MTWETVKTLLLQNIAKGDHIDPSSHYRYVLEKPIDQNGFFKISIGASPNSYIELSLEMLGNVYSATIDNQAIYNRAVIYALYSRAVNNHSCHVHVVGQLFVSAGIMKKQGRNFKIM